MAMAKIILLLLVLVPIRLAAARTDCPNVPLLGAVATCQKACGMDFMYNLCIYMMHKGDADMSPSHMERATAYAILAAHSAVISFDYTKLIASNQLSQNSLSGKQRDAYEGCMNDYAQADSSIDRIADEMLPSCRFTGLADEYTRVITSVEKCRGRLLSPTLMTMPLYPLVLADKNKAVLANMLGKLLGI